MLPSDSHKLTPNVDICFSSLLNAIFNKKLCYVLVVLE